MSGSEHAAPRSEHAVATRTKGELSVINGGKKDSGRRGACHVLRSGSKVANSKSAEFDRPLTTELAY